MSESDSDSPAEAPTMQGREVCRGGSRRLGEDALIQERQEGSSSSSGSEQSEDEAAPPREQLSQMSFGDLLKFKEKVGVKQFNLLYHGQRSTTEKKDRTFKRANKNRPAEMSSKARPPPIREVVAPTKRVARDPRFEAGHISAPEKGAYLHLQELHEKDKKKFTKALKSQRDPETRKAIKVELSKMKSQEMNSEKVARDKTQKQEQKQGVIRQLKEGKRPHFEKKSETKLQDLKEQFLELKKTGKLKKYMERKRKKMRR